LQDDVRFQPLFSSVWSIANLPGAMQSPAFLAYVALTLLGILSFFAHPRALRGWRLTVWLPFAALAAWQARTIPFFVIVAAPIAALNWQDFLAKIEGERMKDESSSFRFILHPFSFILCLSLLVLIYFTWAGWAVGTGREERRVAWGLQTDPS